MDACLLDTDILSDILRQRTPQVVQVAADYLASHGQFSFSAFTRFEIERGYKVNQASRLLRQFAVLCQHSRVFPITEATFSRATDLWVIARRGGHSQNDADLLIAATALEHGLALATANTAHFAWIPQLALSNWREL